MSKLMNYIQLYGNMQLKRDKTIWVFGAWAAEKFADNPKYLFLEVCKSNDIRAIWVTKNKSVLEKLRQDGYEAYLLDSSEGIALQKKAGVFFVCIGYADVYTPALANAVIIQLWHGIPLKKIMYDDKIGQSQKGKGIIGRWLMHFPMRKEYVLSSSPIITNIYKSCFRKKESHILELGQPRNDVFYDKSLYSGGIRSKLNINQNTRLVLYMPTHRNEGKTKMNCEIIMDLDEINNICKKNDCVFLIKKHFYHRNEIDNVNKYSNIKEITNLDCDSQELLYDADVLITDYSSCYIDFLLLNRPIIFYEYDYLTYIMNDRELYFDYDAVTPGEKAHSKEELIGALDNVLRGQDSYEKERERVCDIFYSKDNQRLVGFKIIRYIRDELIR